MSSTLPPFTELIYEVEGHICTITLNRPHRKNALSILIQCFLTICIVTIAWILVGYSIALALGARGIQRQPPALPAAGDGSRRSASRTPP